MGEYATLLADAVLRQRARDAEHAARVETELASRVKSEFIANMSHELRTPLNTVIGFAKLIGEARRHQLSSDQIVEYADLIRDAATHLLTVINDILDISKMQSGKYTLDAREVDLKEVVEATVASFARNAADLGVTIETRADAPAPTVRGDQAKLRQVFNNLISNAVKFTPPGGSVNVSVNALSDGGVAVSDPRHGRRHDQGGDRRRAHALLPGRCQPLALARGRGPRPADRQGAGAAARRLAGGAQRQVARHRGGRDAAVAPPGIGRAGSRHRARIGR